MPSLHEVIKRPLVTEKGVTKKDSERTLCFEVAVGANKTQIRQAVQSLFKVKVAEVRTSTTAGQAAPAREIRRVSRGLEESVREAQDRRKSAGVRGDLREIRHAD